MALTKEKSGVIARLNSEGFTEGKNFIQRTDLCPVSPSIEISGVCNLRCLACPRSDTIHPFENGGFMSLSDYEKTVRKLLNEIPMLHVINLFIWSDPLLHPNLPEIIKMNADLGLGSFLSTNLNLQTEKLEKIIQANPPFMKVTCSGFGKKNYEFNQAGARWDVFYKNMHELSRLIKKYRAGTAVEVFFLITKENITEYKDVVKLSQDLGFRITAGLSMIFPKYAMDFLENIPLHSGAQKAKALMHRELEEMLAAAKTEHEKPCPSRIGFPNINWDLSVLVCCNFNQERLARNFFDVSINDIIKLKDNSPLCQKCISYSLHRYANVQSNIGYVKRLLEKTGLPSYI
ncbi:MAG: radical SAM protein [Spirochaetaceae bacterium]|nr:radical SAM protein [Spirochaetaceae bacterium]